VATFSRTKGLMINEFLTTDHRRIRDMLAGEGSAPFGGRAEQMARLLTMNVNQFFDTAAGAADPEARGNEAANTEMREPGPAPDFGRDQVPLEDYGQSVGVFLDALRGLAQGMRLVPGTKNIVMFSSGVSGVALFGAPSVSMPDSLNTPRTSSNGRTPWRSRTAIPASARSSKARWSSSRRRIARSSPSTSPEPSMRRTSSRSGSRQRQRDRPHGQGHLRQRLPARVVERDGRPVLPQHHGPESRDRPAPETTGSYYVLGYAATPVWDGKYHKIKVKVDRRGVDVFGESGYSNPKPFAQYTNFERFVHIMTSPKGKRPIIKGTPGSRRGPALPLKDKAGISLFGAFPAESYKILAGGPAKRSSSCPTPETRFLILNGSLSWIDARRSLGLL